MTMTIRDKAAAMCYPDTQAQRPVAGAEVGRLSKSGAWSPSQMVRSLNKQIVTNGLHISRKIVRVTGKAKSKVVTVQRWVFNLTFAKIVIPLVFFAFLLLLHPHTEIQVGAVTTFVALFLAFLLLSSASCSSKDDLHPDPEPVKEEPRAAVVARSSPAAIALYNLLPLAALSRAWGGLASTPFPRPLQLLILRVFAAATGCNLAEAERDISSYATLSAWFTRRLRPGARPVSCSELVSPADGAVTGAGSLAEDGYTHTVKGLSYSLELFLGCLDTAASVLGRPGLDTQYSTDSDYDSADSDSAPSSPAAGPQLAPAWPAVSPHHAQLLSCGGSTQLYESTIYLSPGDYHRFHSPADWTVLMRRHFPGSLYSVSPKLVRLLPECILTNERVAWYGRWKYGTFIMVAVAATNVGDIQADFDKEISTNNKENVTQTEKIYKQPLEFRRGDDFGHFNFGSTIVLIYEAPTGINFGPNPLRRVRMGEALI